ARAERRQHRRHQQLVQANQRDQQPLHRFKACLNSRTRLSKSSSVAVRLATRTISFPPGKSDLLRRYTSPTSLFVRFRSPPPPSFLRAVPPILAPPLATSKRKKRKGGVPFLRPRLCTCRNSLRRRSRSEGRKDSARTYFLDVVTVSRFRP